MFWSSYLFESSQEEQALWCIVKSLAASTDQRRESEDSSVMNHQIKIRTWCLFFVGFWKMTTLRHPISISTSLLSSQS